MTQHAARSASAPPDAQGLERSRHEVHRQLLRVAQRAQQDLPPETFYVECLGTVVAAMMARGATLWRRDAQGAWCDEFDLSPEIEGPPSSAAAASPDAPAASQEPGQAVVLHAADAPRLADQASAECGQRTRGDVAHEEAQAVAGSIPPHGARSASPWLAARLEQALRTLDGLIVPAAAPSGEASPEAAPDERRHVLLLAPVFQDGVPWGVLLVRQRAGAPLASVRAYLRFACQAALIIGQYVTLRALRRAASQQGDSAAAAVEQFARLVYGAQGMRATCLTLCNEARRLLQCDRVAVLVPRGRHWRVEAISGQEAFDSRSRTVRLMNRLAEVVAAAGDEVWYPDEHSPLPPQIERTLSAYVDETQARLVAVVPLWDTAEPQEAAAALRPRGHPCGALIVEQLDQRQSPAALRGALRGAVVHAGLALRHARAYDGGWGLRLARRLGRSRALLAVRSLPRTLAVLGALAAVVAALCLVPADFALEGRGTLQPVVRRDVFARSDGIVHSIKVSTGQQVRAGQMLAELRNVDVEVALAALHGEWASTVEQLGAVQTALLSGKRLESAERDRLHGEEERLQQTLAGLRRQLQLYEAKLEQLQVVSPIAGEVITWDVQELLRQRPVQRGQLLLTVADTAGPWELHVRMPEDRMGHIFAAQQQLGDALPVEFILANDPGVRYEGRIKEVHRRAEVHGDEGNTVLIRVQIDHQALPHLRPGASVVAQVHCGRRSIGYVWFHDLIEFVQSRILF
jgi:multidrug efflux pump subunit AcrA (membrane-fusion protein)